MMLISHNSWILHVSVVILLLLLLLLPLPAHAALDSRTTSIRELLRQVRAKRFIEANPKLAINVDVHNRPVGPTANFVFIDGEERFFETKDYHAPEVMFQVHLKGMQLDAEYEMAGKSIDEP